MNKTSWVQFFNFAKWLPLGFSFFLSLNVILSYALNSVIIAPLWLILVGAVVYALVAYLLLDDIVRLHTHLQALSDYACFAGFIVAMIYILAGLL